MNNGSSDLILYQPQKIDHEKPFNGFSVGLAWQFNYQRTIGTKSISPFDSPAALARSGCFPHIPEKQKYAPTKSSGRILYLYAP
jgi:hypothetical protein